ncbi:Hypothetical protein PBC10988_2470 [Planctomycetales bacterium 10988]|nr:Hypothetical protein PBC10988_2470 [Planctomycetales bacterium 10988]
MTQQRIDLVGKYPERVPDVGISGISEGVEDGGEANEEDDGGANEKVWELLLDQVKRGREEVLPMITSLVAGRDCLEFRVEEIEAILKGAERLLDEARHWVEVLARASFLPVNSDARERLACGNPEFEFEPFGVSARQVVQGLELVCRRWKEARESSLLSDGENTAGPSVAVAAQVLVEITRLSQGLKVFQAVLEFRSPHPNIDYREADPWGVGKEYATHFNAWGLSLLPPVKIATQKRPDADALVATWIVHRTFSSSIPCLVEFVSRSLSPRKFENYHALIEVGKVFDPRRKHFDSNTRLTFSPDEECATSLVGRHASVSSPEVKELIELIRAGDRIAGRRTSSAYQRSASNGLHALIACARQYSQGDQMLYQSLAAYLDARYSSI